MRFMDWKIVGSFAVRNLQCTCIDACVESFESLRLSFRRDPFGSPEVEEKETISTPAPATFGHEKPLMACVLAITRNRRNVGRNGAMFLKEPKCRQCSSFTSVCQKYSLSVSILLLAWNIAIRDNNI